MAYSLTFKPETLGKLGPTSGTPIAITANLLNSTDGYKASGNTDPSNDLYGNKITIQASGANTGILYVMKSGGSRTTLAGVIATLNAGDSWSIGDYNRVNVYRAGAFFVDVDTTGDYCYGIVDTA